MKMCLTCGTAVRKHFPLLTHKEQVDILWCGTAFPAGCGEHVEKQLSDLAEKSKGNYEAAMDITHKEFDEVWERTRPERERQPHEENNH